MKRSTFLKRLGLGALVAPVVIVEGAKVIPTSYQMHAHVGDVPTIAQEVTTTHAHTLSTPTIEDGRWYNDEFTEYKDRFEINGYKPDYPAGLYYDGKLIVKIKP